MKNEITKNKIKNFTEIYSPIKMLRTSRKLRNLPDVINEDKNSLSYYSKNIGEDKLLAVIELHILTLCQAVNVQNVLNEYQIKFCDI